MVATGSLSDTAVTRIGTVLDELLENDPVATAPGTDSVWSVAHP